MPAVTAAGPRVPGAGLLGLPSSGSNDLSEVAENTSCLYKMTCPPRPVPEAPRVGVILDCRWASGLRPRGDAEVGEKTGDFPRSSNSQPSWEWAPMIHQEAHPPAAKGIAVCRG